MSCHFGWWQTTFNSVQLQRGQLHVNVILLQLPESLISFLFYRANWGYCCKGPAGLPNLNNKARTKWILVVVVKCCHRENGLLAGKKIIAKTLTCVQTPPPLTGYKNVWYFCDSNPATPCISCEIKSFNVHGQCLLTDNLCRGRAGGDLSNNTPAGQRKMWKNMKSWQLSWKFPCKSCSTTHLHFLQANSIIIGGLFTKNVPTKIERKKGGGGGQENQKVMGSLLNPKTINFSFCPCMNFRSYGLEQQTVWSLIGKQGFGQFWFFWPDDQKKAWLHVASLMVYYFSRRFPGVKGLIRILGN